MANRIITIGRQFGSGGHEIGERVAKELGISFYDRALIELASKKLGIDEYDLEQVDESAANHFLSIHKMAEDTSDALDYGLPLNDSMYLAQCDIISSLADKGDCVIIGRCADYVLRSRKNCVNVFICASEEDRIKRIAQRYGLTEKEAKKAVKRADGRRKYYYETYTENKWGSIHSHQALLNVSRLGADRTVAIIKDLYRHIADM